MSLSFQFSYTNVTHKAADNEHTVKMHSTDNGNCPWHPGIIIKKKRLFRRTKKKSCPSCVLLYKEKQKTILDLASKIDTATKIADETEISKLLKELEMAKSELAILRSHIAAPNAPESECDPENKDADDVDDVDDDVPADKASTHPGPKMKIKIATIGDSSVGKTSIINMLVNGKFNSQEVATIGATSTLLNRKRGEHTKNTRDPATGQPLQVIVWDTAGQEQFSPLAKIMYQGCDIAILIFDVTQPNTLSILRKWAQDLKDTAPANVLLLLVGNKVDLVDARNVDSEAGKKFSKEIGAVGYFEVSAREDINIDEVFDYAIQKVLMRNRDEMKLVGGGEKPNSPKAGVSHTSTLASSEASPKTAAALVKYLASTSGANLALPNVAAPVRDVRGDPRARKGGGAGDSAGAVGAASRKASSTIVALVDQTDNSSPMPQVEAGEVMDRDGGDVTAIDLRAANEHLRQQKWLTDYYCWK